MSACPHDPSYPDLVSLPTMHEALSHCSLVEGDERVAKQRALTSADGATTRIDSAYWQDLDDAQRAAVVAHERAHPAIGMQVDCEGCADKVGGYYMRAWGYAPQIVRQAYSSLRVKRGQDQGNIADNAHVGARHAEKALAERGLLGKTQNQIASTLLSARQAKAATASGKASETNTTRAPPAPAPIKPTSPALTVVLPIPGIAPTSPIQSTGGNAVDPGGPGSAPIAPAPDGTESPSAPPSVDATTDASTTAPAADASGDVAGDVVSAVLGENARPHAGKVLIGAAVAAILAVVLVVVVRKRSR